MNPEDILKSIIEKLNIIDGADIPAIDLYMDQVTTFMDKQLSGSKRRSDDKVLTKTMINNYSKNDLLPPPVKKRYSKQHVILLILIYYYKNILSINDINTILTPLCETYFEENKICSLDRIYRESCAIETDMIDTIVNDIKAQIDDSHKRFTDLPEKDQEFLQLYSLITSLCFDVYLKKQMLEGIIDRMNLEHSLASAKEPKKHNETKNVKEVKEAKHAKEGKAPKEKK